MFIAGNEIDHEIAEIAENLHRSDLTKEQRDAHIRRYAELLKEQEQRNPKPQNAAVEVGYEEPPPQKKGRSPRFPPGWWIGFAMILGALGWIALIALIVSWLW